jgi:hypothetical protein
MKLRDLDATFLRILPDAELSPGEQGHHVFHEQEERAGADGVMFLCPKCYAANGGPVGTHAVICWFVGVSQDFPPQPGRWEPNGETLDDLTFTGPAAASVLLQGGCGWHGFVRNGDAA